MADIAVDKAEAAKSRVGPFKYFSQVRAEGRKVHWTTLKETTTVSTMVGIMVVLAALFFLLVDSILKLAIQGILSLG